MELLYNILVKFGLSKSFIKWVKLFNKDIKAYILQCGFLSEDIPIERGCRQGDQLAPYLFLMGAEIMSILIKLDPKLLGLNIKDNSIKITETADDTTLILDRSQHSLDAALNMLEIFGNFSGLKRNMEKTKVIWIGRKRYSKEKLNVSYNLQWGSHEFTMLGLNFSTNLKEISNINYTRILKKS